LIGKAKKYKNVSLRNPLQKTPYAFNACLDFEYNTVSQRIFSTFLFPIYSLNLSIITRFSFYYKGLHREFSYWHTVCNVSQTDCNQRIFYYSFNFFHRWCVCIKKVFEVSSVYIALFAMVVGFMAYYAFGQTGDTAHKAADTVKAAVTAVVSAPAQRLPGSRPKA